MEIKDYPNYLIFRNGAVLSKGFDKFHPPRFLKHNINKTTGYYYVNLYKDKKPRPHYIHRLIGCHFIPNPENKRCIDHKDRNKLNNSLTNLRWATCSENVINTGIRSDNKTGHIGIAYCNTRKKYKFKNKRYKTIEEILNTDDYQNYIKNRNKYTI